MKATVLALTFIALAGCRDASGPEPVFTLSAVVDGSAWTPGREAPEPFAFYSPADSSFAFSGIASFGYQGSRQIIVAIKPVAGLGTYALGEPDSGSWATLDVLEGPIGQPGSTWITYRTSATAHGRVVITQWDEHAHTIAGTFEFEGRSSTDAPAFVSSGAFSGRYTVSQ